MGISSKVVDVLEVKPRRTAGAARCTSMAKDPTNSRPEKVKRKISYPLLLLSLPLLLE